MASRTYSQINHSITGSRKFRGLGHRARWAWLCAHLKADYAGIAEYPKQLWAIDAELPAEEMDGIIASLVSANLIEWSDSLEVVRVTGFIKQRPPDNASAAQRLCMDLTDRLYDADSELEGMLLTAAAEFSVAAVGRSLRWEKDRARFRDDIGQFLRATAQDFGDRFLDAIQRQLDGAGRPTRTEIEGLLPTLLQYQQDTVSTPSPHPVDTQDVDKTRRRQDQNQDEDKNKDGAKFAQREHDQALAQAQTADVLRKDEIRKDRSQQGPSESLKRSALVVGMREAG